MSNTSETPITPMSVTGDELFLKVLYNAVHLRALHMNLSNDIDAKEFRMLSKWSATIIQAIKDQKFDANALPFPEK